MSLRGVADDTPAAGASPVATGDALVADFENMGLGGQSYHQPAITAPRLDLDAVKNHTERARIHELVRTVAGRIESRSPTAFRVAENRNATTFESVVRSENVRAKLLAAIGGIPAKRAEWLRQTLMHSHRSIRDVTATIDEVASAKNDCVFAASFLTWLRSTSTSRSKITTLGVGSIALGLIRRIHDPDVIACLAIGSRDVLLALVHAVLKPKNTDVATGRTEHTTTTTPSHATVLLYACDCIKYNSKRDRESLSDLVISRLNAMGTATDGSSMSFGTFRALHYLVKFRVVNLPRADLLRRFVAFVATAADNESGDDVDDEPDTGAGVGSDGRASEETAATSRWTRAHREAVEAWQRTTQKTTPTASSEMLVASIKRDWFQIADCVTELCRRTETVSSYARYVMFATLSVIAASTADELKLQQIRLESTLALDDDGNNDGNKEEDAASAATVDAVGEMMERIAYLNHLAAACDADMDTARWESYGGQFIRDSLARHPGLFVHAPQTAASASTAAAVTSMQLFDSEEFD